MREKLGITFVKSVKSMQILRIANVTKINSLLLGLKPYAGLSPVDLIEQLKKGYRMEKPNGCSDEM